MKRILSNIAVGIFALLSVLGVNQKATKAQIYQESITSISATSPLYLLHANQINSDSTNLVTQHYSHGSHESHGSHVSHGSHQSGY